MKRQFLRQDAGLFCILPQHLPSACYPFSGNSTRCRPGRLTGLSARFCPAADLRSQGWQDGNTCEAFTPRSTLGYGPGACTHAMVHLGARIPLTLGPGLSNAGAPPSGLQEGAGGGSHGEPQAPVSAPSPLSFVRLPPALCLQITLDTFWPIHEAPAACLAWLPDRKDRANCARSTQAVQG